MVSPRKEHSGATKALKKWRKRCGDPKKTADDLLDLALKALDDSHGGGRALLARGAGERTAALLLRAAARKMRCPAPAYLRSVAWSLNELDAFEAAALRLKARLLPGQPDYARLRLARDAVRVAASRAPAWPLIEDDDANAHAAILKLAEAADAPGARKMLMEKGGSRLAAIRCAATGRTVLHSVCDRNRRDGDETAGAKEDDGSKDDAWDADAVCFADALLAHGADPSSADDCGATAVHLAASRLRPRLVARLARGQAPCVDARGRTPLHFVVTGLLTTTRLLRPRTPAQREAAMARLERATRCATDCAAELLSTHFPTTRDKSGSTPLALACAARASTDLAATFVEALTSSADADDEACVWDAAAGAAKNGGHRSLALLLDLAQKRGWEAAPELSPLLRAACERGALRCVRLLLEAGADPDDPGGGSWPPLHIAARRDDEALCRLLLDKGAKAATAVARSLSKVFADDNDLAEPPSSEMKAFRQETLRVLADPKLVHILFPDEMKSPAWTAASVAALQGHCDCAAACLVKGRDRLEGDGVGVLTAGVLGGGDVASLCEALSGAARVPTAALARCADRRDANFGGGRPMLLAACLGRADALKALARLGADSDAFVDVARDDCVAAAARAARCEGAFEATNRDVIEAEAAAGLTYADCKVARDADTNASKLRAAAESLLRAPAFEGAVRELFKPLRPPDRDRVTEYAARGALLCLGDEANASGEGWWKAARKFGRRLRLADALLAVTDAVATQPAYLLTRCWPRKAVAEAAAKCHGEGDALGALGAWLQACVSAAEASHPDLRAARAVNAARRKRAAAQRDADSARKAVDLAEKPRRGHATDPHAAKCTVGLIAAALAFGAPGDARGPASAVRDALERAEAAKVALDLGADPERRDGSGATALALAVRRGHVAFALDLVQRGARPDGGDGSALEAAAGLAAAGAVGAGDLVAALLRAGASARTEGGDSALKVIEARGAPAAVAVALLARGAACSPSLVPKRPQLASTASRWRAVFAANGETPPAVLAEVCAAAASARAAAKDADVVELALGGAPATTYERRLGRLRCLDDAHEHVGLVLVDDDDGAAGDVELEDGSAVKLSALAADCRLFWRLRRAPRPRVATGLHAACAACASVQALDLILRGSGTEEGALACLSARDAHGRTPLGVALYHGQKAAAAWCLDVREHFADAQALAESATSWPEPAFDAVCLRAASRRAHGADAELRRWRRQSVLVDADLEAEHAAVDRGGAAPRLASVLVTAGALANELAGRRVASLWSQEAPLLCADRAKKALAEFGVAPSSLDGLKQLDAEGLKTRVSLRAVEASAHLLLAPRPKRTTTITDWGDEREKARERLERCLALFHAPPQYADALETIDDDVQDDAKVPAGVLREVRNFWKTKAEEDGAERFRAFLELWRRQPKDVLAAVDAGRAALAWLRRVAAARILDVVASHASSGVDERKLAHSLATRATTRAARDDILSQELRDAQASLGHASRGAERIARTLQARRPEMSRKLRSVDLIHRRDWAVLLATPDAALGDRRLVDLRMAVCGACVVVCSAVDGPEDIDEKLLAPLEKAWRRPVTSIIEDVGAAQAAERLLRAMRSYDASAARKRASQDAEFVETLRLAARDVKAARHDAQNFATTDANDANRLAADAAATWVIAAHKTTAHPLLIEDEGENLLDLAISALSDEDPLLPRMLAALGAERSAELAVAGDGDCALVKCCLAPWKPRTLGALLRAAAGSGFGGEVCAEAPRKQGRAKPLQLALESAPKAIFLARGLQQNISDRRNRAALLALLQADPNAAADDGSLLQLACEKGYLDLAAALLSHGGVLGPHAPQGRVSPLHAAAEAGATALCARILAAAARAGGAGAVRSALLAAWEPQVIAPALQPAAGSDALLKKLAAAQAEGDEEDEGGAYAVHCAVRGQAPDCVELLLDALRDPAMVSPTPLPDDGDDAHRPRHYRDAPLGASLLHEAAFRQAPQCLERLLRHGGFDVSSKAPFPPVGVVTPLQVAVRRGDAACVALLLRAGATPSAEDAYQGAKRGRGASSAHVLTKLLSDRVLVDLNAPLDDETKETLLHAACRHGQADFARLLLTWGASYASRDAAHAAPIHNAIAAGHGAVTRILAQYNTDYDAKAHVLAWGLRRHARRCRRKKMAIDAVAEAAKRDDLWPEAMTSTRSGRLARVSTEHSSAEAP